MATAYNDMSKANHNKSILLVDDEEIILGSLQKDFQQENFVVTTAGSGEEAVGKLQENHFDAVITNLVMDGIGGLEVLQEAKKSYPDISVIILTGQGALSSAIDALRMGADDYLLKPCAFDELLVRLSKIFDQKLLRQQLNNAKEESLHNKAALSESEEDLRIMTDFAYDWEYWVDPEGNYKYMSPSCERITGYNIDEFKSRARLVEDICDPEDRAKLSHHLQQESSQRHYVHKIDFRIITKQGKIIWLNHICQPVYSEDGHYLGRRASNRDITNRKNMEEELIKAKKLQATATLAGGIAHDYNNLLTAILGNIDLAKIVIDQDSAACEYLNNAEQASFRARDLTQKFITFSSGGAPIKQVATIDKALQGAMDLALSGSNVKYEFSAPEDSWSVEVDLGQLNQAITNIITNSREAMPDGGTIHVKVEHLESLVYETEAGLDLPENKYLKISFQDEGAGISEEDLVNILDPYFSTKERGTQKGMGLGLTIVHSIIKKHNGDICIHSSPGQGTTVIMYLPAAVQQGEQGTAIREGRPIEGTSRPTKRHKILIMDDEDIVRDVVGDMLSHLGYEVLCAKDGEEAIEIYKNAQDSPAPVDLVILDLTIPAGMGGKEAVRGIHQINSAARAIVSSGYSNDPIMENYQEYGFCAAIVKPYQIKGLNKVVSRFLG